MRRSSIQALLGVAALLLQIVLPAVHPQHGAQSVGVVAHAADDHHAATSVAGHDALDCPLCAALAHGRAATLASVPVPSGGVAPIGAVVAPQVPLLAAPALYSAAPRGPPALA